MTIHFFYRLGKELAGVWQQSRNLPLPQLDKVPELVHRVQASPEGKIQADN